jgi:cell division protein FtsB
LDHGVETEEELEPDYKKENEKLKKKLKELEDQIKLLQNPIVNENSPLDYGVEKIKNKMKK